MKGLIKKDTSILAGRLTGKKMNQADKELIRLTGKKHIFFTDRGNTSILLALKLAKSIGKTDAFIQDQGGWITYGQFIRKLKLEMHILQTDCGIIKQDSLSNIDGKSLILMNSMPGYHALQEDIDKIYRIAKKASCLLINDVSGSIGRKEAKYGDMILGSFGEWKPVELKYGGFLAYDDESYTTFFRENMKKEVRDFSSELVQKIGELPERLKKNRLLGDKIKDDLKDFDIIHKDSEGFNVIVKFDSDKKKLDLLDYCKLHGLEYTICPRYIRVLEDAVSIELKRTS